jgi:ArsR family transcriptional regulator
MKRSVDISYVASNVEVGGLSRLFKALGDETRLRIVALLAHGELCVAHIEDALGLSQPNASRHLSILSNAGVVTRRRADRWVYYKLAPRTKEDTSRHIETLVGTFANNDSLRRDVERLRKAKGPEAGK